MGAIEHYRVVPDFSGDFCAVNGVVPLLRDIPGHIDSARSHAARKRLQPLGKKEVIRRGATSSRTTPGQAPVNRVHIPILGMIPAGNPSDQEQQSDRCVSIDEDTLQVPKNARTFALEVRGDSMIDAHIVDGDFVIMELRDPNHRDIVAALIDGETTLKRFLVQKGKPFLRAENSKYPDLIPAHELVIQGVFRALLRVDKRRL
jgi:repressor LexA